MPNEKTTEEEQEKQEEQTTASQEIEEEKEKVAEDRVNEFLGDEAGVEIEETEEEQAEEKVEEVEEETEEPEQTVDKEALKEELKPELEEELREKYEEEFKGKAKQEIADDIIESLSGKTQEEVEEEGFQFAWEEEGRNPRDYTEIAKETARYREHMEEQKAKEQEEMQKKAQEKQQKAAEEWNNFWDEQLEDLREDDRLPTVENPDDENDPGKKAQKELFETMYKVNQQRAKEGKPLVNSIKEIYYEHYQSQDTESSGGKEESSQPAGADAPVSAGKKTSTTSKDTSFNYEDIHNARDFRDLLDS